MKKIILLTSIILQAYAAIAQKDSINISQLANESKSEIIAKTRRLLLDKFVENDLVRVKVIKDYLLSFDDENYITLYPQEYWLLSFWTHEYKDILETISKTDTLIKQRNRIPPSKDFLNLKLIEKSKDSLTSLENTIYTSSLPAEEKDFLVIHLKFLADENYYENDNQEQLNHLADLYLKNYPSSPYNSFVKKYIRKKFSSSKYGGGYSFSSGTKVFTRTLNDYFKMPVLIGFSFDISYNKFYYYLDASVGFSKTKKTVSSQNAVWHYSSKATTGLAQLGMGYTVADNKIVKLVPYIGIGVLGISADSTKNYPELKNLQVPTKFCTSVGLNADFKISKPKNQSRYSYQQKSEQYTFLRLGYSYSLINPKNQYVDYSGNVHRIVIALGIYGRGNKRVE